jgi:hypothetical protein
VSNAEQLIEAANYVVEILGEAPDCTPGADSALFVAKHILATVFPDDGQKVTQKRLRAAGWTYNSHDRAWYRGKEPMPYVVFYNNKARLRTWSIDVAPGSMGQLRQLLSGLGY